MAIGMLSAERAALDLDLPDGKDEMLVFDDVAMTDGRSARFDIEAASNIDDRNGHWIGSVYIGVVTQGATVVVTISSVAGAGSAVVCWPRYGNSVGGCYLELVQLSDTVDIDEDAVEIMDETFHELLATRFGCWIRPLLRQPPQLEHSMTGRITTHLLNHHGP